MKSKPYKVIPALLLFFFCQYAIAQKDDHNEFCRSLAKVLESGRMEEFESLKGNNAKQSPFLQVPGYSIKLDKFPVTYVDKDRRFVGKTNLNFDSLSAVKSLEEYKEYVSFCLDSSQWQWSETYGDDSTTVFFKELKEWNASQSMFTLTLAITRVANKVYSINMYIRKKRR